MADKIIPDDLRNTTSDKKNNDYFLVTVNDLNPSQLYSFQFAWVYEDKTVSPWSSTFSVRTKDENEVKKPKFLQTDLSYLQGVITVQWDGKDYLDGNYPASLDRVDVYVRDNTSLFNPFVLKGSFKLAGKLNIPVEPGDYSVYLKAVNKSGIISDASDVRATTAKADPPVNPSSVVAAWSGTTFTVSFTHDTTVSANKYLKEYIINLIPPLPTLPKAFPLTPTSGSSQKFSLSLEQNQAAFGDAQQQFTGTVTAVDVSNNKSTAISFTGPAVVTALPAPVITALETVNGYSVSYITPTSNTFDKIHIEEVVSNSATAPTSGFVERINGSSNPLLYPAGTGKRWVRARFSDKLRLYTGYSNVVAVTPIDVIAAALDITPPTTATINSAVWSGNDIIISATVAEDAKKFIIRLTNGSTVGFFTKFVSVSGTSQTILLTEQELYNTLGSYFTSFSGLFVSADSLDNRDSGASFSVAEKTNELVSTTPTFILTAISNGYSVSYTLPASASYAKVYASTVSGFTPNDATNLVYSGVSPGIVIDSVYTLKYVKIKYFKTDGSASLISAQQSITPADPGMLSLIDNEVKISTNGSILAGDSATSGGRAILNKTGLYIYNTGSSPTTQIIANATDGSPTFLTTNAKIADWKIYSNKIENQLIPGITKYAGLSASGTYAFWAGSTTAGGDAQSVFSVTQDGLVQAKDITISGGSLTVGATSIAASTGILTATSVDLSGKITASTGKIGNLNIDSGALYTGTTPLVTSVTFNSGGIAAYNALGIKAFGLDTSGFLEVKSANINGWTVDAVGYADQIRKTSGANTIKLDATLGSVQVDGTGYSAGFGMPDGNNIVFWAGASRALTAPFYVKKDGSVKLQNAEITGTSTFGGKNAADLVSSLQLTDGTTVISGSNILSGTIDLNNGATIRSKASGSRLEITSSGLKGYAVNGTTKVVEFDTSTGKLYIGSADVSSGVADIDLNNVTTIDGGKITTGLIKSVDYDPGTGNFAADGFGIDLANKTIRSKKFSIDNQGNAYFAGTIESGTLITAPNITGGVYKTAAGVGESSVAGVRIDTDGIKVYTSASNTPTIQLGATGLTSTNFKILANGNAEFNGSVVGGDLQTKKTVNNDYMLLKDNNLSLYSGNVQIGFLTTSSNGVSLSASTNANLDVGGRLTFKTDGSAFFQSGNHARMDFTSANTVITSPTQTSNQITISDDKVTVKTTAGNERKLRNIAFTDNNNQPSTGEPGDIVLVYSV